MVFSLVLHCIVAFCACFRLALGFASWFCFLCFDVFLNGLWLEDLWMEVWRKAKSARKRGKGRVPNPPCLGHDIQLHCTRGYYRKQPFQCRVQAPQCRGHDTRISCTRDMQQKATSIMSCPKPPHVVGTTSGTKSTTFFFFCAKLYRSFIFLSLFGGLQGMF